MIMSRKNVQPEEDFGFSITHHDEEEFTSRSQDIEQIYKEKLLQVEGLILPLLYNLMKNPEKPMIKWENREEVIKSQIEKITAITRS